MTAMPSLRLGNLFLRHFNDEADAKAFFNELEIVLKERSGRVEKTHVTEMK